MKRKTFLSILFSALALLVTGGPAAWGQKTYVNGIDSAFPPFAFVDRNGNPSGFDVEALDWIAKKMGFTVRHQPVKWESVISALTSGEIDIIASGLSVTPQRAEAVSFTTPYYEAQQVLVSRKDNPDSLRKLLNSGKAIGAQRGAVTGRLLESLVGRKGYRFRLSLYDTTEASMKDLAEGGIAASGMESTLADVIIKDKRFKIAGVLDAPQEKYAYAVRKGDAEMLDKLNAGLNMLMNDPHWAELKKKYDLR